VVSWYLVAIGQQRYLYIHAQVNFLLKQYIPIWYVFISYTETISHWAKSAISELPLAWLENTFIKISFVIKTSQSCQFISFCFLNVKLLFFLQKHQQFCAVKVNELMTLIEYKTYCPKALQCLLQFIFRMEESRQ